MNSLKLFFLLITLSCGSLAFSQPNTYVIIDEANVANIEDYKKAFDNANFDAYRYIEKNRTIVFDTGVIVELLSVKALKNKGIAVNENRAHAYDPNKKPVPCVWKLSSNGTIVQTFENTSKSKK
ncbi:MAG: hypothetical protein WDZ35_03560 [Crocinitomicaceae bacterium]